MLELYMQKLLSSTALCLSAQDAVIQACDRGSGQAAELLAAIEEQIALRDQWRVSSDHSANGNGQSVNQPEKKPNPVPVIAVGVNEVKAFTVSLRCDHRMPPQ